MIFYSTKALCILSWETLDKLKRQKSEKGVTIFLSSFSVLTMINWFLLLSDVLVRPVSPSKVNTALLPLKTFFVDNATEFEMFSQLKFFQNN